MNWKSLPFSGLLFLCTSISAQEIQGVVISEKTQKVLSDVNVYVKSLKRGTITNSDGFFNLDLNVKRKDSLYFSYIGYQTKAITIREFLKIEHPIELKEARENISQTTINYERVLKPSLKYTKVNSFEIAAFDFGFIPQKNGFLMVSGDLSYKQDTQKKIMYDMEKYVRPTLKDLFREMNSNFSREKYSSALYSYTLGNTNLKTLNASFQPRSGHEVVLLHNKLYVFGGKTLSTNTVHQYLDPTVEIYDLSTGEYFKEASNPHPTVNAGISQLGNSIILMGGSTRDRRKGKKYYSNKVHLFDTQTGFWYRLNDLEEGMETQTIRIKNNIYLLGGYKDKPLDLIKKYNLKTGQWTDIGTLFKPMERPSLSQYRESIYMYDRGNLIVFDTEKLIMHQYKININLVQPEIWISEGSLYLVGGFVEDTYEQTPSNIQYKIKLDDLNYTQIDRQKQF